ncbi:DEKNAAC104910 [Brettanomyces naardenensis]|uniref:DEKNAAC104910 n=1 Tax=Brettanomyces naardenensis TaxID=13370 RepID=A0A448YS00_BRENA|nr:DEKNAAC104910 [Brettanomyces naardenensis]
MTELQEMPVSNSVEVMQVPAKVATFSNGTVVGVVDGDNNDINNSEAVSPLKVPIPESAEDSSQLLRRYRELEASHTHESEKQGILQMLRRINRLQEKYEKDVAEREKLWKKNDEEVNVDLLERQIASFQMLSKDLDLPLDLQLELDQEKVINALEDDEKLKYGSDCLSKLDLPLDDYEKKALILGIQPSKPSANASLDSVGTPFAEEQLKAKIQMRINELEQLPSNIGCYDSGAIENDLEHSNDEVIKGIDDLKIQGIFELKALRLLPLQKQLRNKLIVKSATDTIYNDEDLNQYSVFKTWKRTYCIRPKQKVAQTARLAEKLQEQQKKEHREQMQKRRRTRLQGLIEVINEAQNEVLARKNLRLSLGKAVNHMHQQSEREESRRMERTAKQRLQALKANDEEAYIKLLDETKDQRITHLLKQTNSFLDSLATAVKVQQQESKIMEKMEKVDVETPAESALPVVPQPPAEEEEKDKTDYYEVAHHVKENVTEQPSLLVGGKLKEYQIRGLEWMVSLYNNHLNGILADEMGLGKTIQSIALITYLIGVKHETGKFLVIVPLSTITNWTMEFDRWAPTVKKIVYKGSQQQRKALSYSVRTGDFTVLLTTYEYVIRDRPMLAKFKWAHMIIDEGHRLKNTHSKLFMTLTTYYHTRNRLILTGTPLQNSLPELWALLNFILPKVFNSVKSFDEWFNTPFENTGHQEKLELSEEESLLIIRRLHKVLRPFLLRRLKKDVEKDLPNKVEKVIKCKLSALQTRIYKQLLDHNALFIGSGSIGANKSGLRGLNNKIMQLRKICNHPFVFEEVEDIVNPSRLTTDLIWRSSGKFELLDRILPKLQATHHRTLMFFQMTQVMDIMEDFLRLRNVKYMRLDGSTKADDRQDMLKAFNAPDSDYFCFLLSTRAGGLGLNLQSADTVVIFDTDWNPHQDLQAQDRAHRIGQKHEVRIYRLITEDSVEEVILERAHQKLDIDGKVIQAGRFDNKSSAEEQEAFLKRMIESEKQKAMEHDTDEMDDEEMNEILARSDTEKVLFEKMDAERHRAEKDSPPRLMTDNELPEVFKVNMEKELEPDHEEIHRRRARKRVIYDDGLTEEQWLQALDDENDSVEAAAIRKRKSLRKRRARKAAKRSGSEQPGDESTDLEDFDDEDEGEHSSDADGSLDYSDDEPPAKRRRSRTPKRHIEELGEDAEPEEPEEQEPEDGYALPDEEPYVSLGVQLVDKLTELTDENGRKIAELFMTLPPKKIYPDYYQIIQHPVAIREIRNGLRKGRYENYYDFKNELETMIKNAKTYNQEGSMVYHDAVRMEELSDEAFKKIEAKLGIALKKGDDSI